MKLQSVLQVLKKTGKIRGLLAVVCAVMIPFWIFVAAPQILRIPDTFSYVAEVTSVDNFYDATLGDYRGEQYSQTEFSYAVTEKQEDVLTIRNTFHVRTLSGETIFVAEPLYGIDALTGKHVYGFGDADRDGYLFAPRGVKEGQSFTYWHAVSNTPAVMSYQGAEYLYGLRVLKFSSNYGGAVDQTQALGFLPDVGETKGIRLESTNTLWIEPVTGYLVKQEDYSTDYFYYDLQTGERIGPYNQFVNSYTEESIQEHVQIARSQKYISLGTFYGIPALFGILALLFIFGGVVRLSAFKGITGTHVVSIVVLGIMLSVSVGAYVFVDVSVKERLHEQLERQSVEIEKKVAERITAYTSVLYGGRALFDASESVSREEWGAYVRSLELDLHFPGILALGYAPIVTEENKEAYILATRAEGLPNFDIRPSGTRAIYTPVDFMEPPTELNLRAFGFDMYSEAIRRNAMLQANESKSPSATSHIRLAQTDQGVDRPGMLLFLSVFPHDGDASDQDAQQPIGYVLSGFYIDTFMGGLWEGTSSDIVVSVYDGTHADPEHLIYTSSSAPDKQETSSAFFERKTTLFFGGVPWIVHFSNAQETHGSVLDRALPGATLALGALLSFSVFAVLISIGRSKERATQLARTLTKNLAQEELALKERNALLEEKIVELDTMNKAMIDREIRMMELKEKLKAYETRSR